MLLFLIENLSNPQNAQWSFIKYSAVSSKTEFNNIKTICSMCFTCVTESPPNFVPFERLDLRFHVLNSLPSSIPACDM